MERSIYVRLNPQGTASLGRILRFDISIGSAVGKSYETLQEGTYTTFAMRGSPTRHGGSDQRIEDLFETYRDRVPKEKLNDFDRIVNLWRNYHLNDCKPGTKAQMDAISNAIRELTFDDLMSGSAQPFLRPRASYVEVRTFLKRLGLFSDRGYVYGNDWLIKPIPDDDIKFIQSLIERWGSPDA